MGMLHLAPKTARISVKRFKTGFNGSEVMCLEILSEGATRILRAFYWHLAAVR